MLQPNAPRMITVVLAVALIVVGFSATIFPIDFANALLDVVTGAVGFELELTTEIGWLFLLAGDALLVAGSLLPGI